MSVRFAPELLFNLIKTALELNGWKRFAARLTAAQRNASHSISGTLDELNFLPVGNQRFALEPLSKLLDNISSQSLKFQQFFIIVLQKTEVFLQYSLSNTPKYVPLHRCKTHGLSWPLLVAHVRRHFLRKAYPYYHSQI